MSTTKSVSFLSSITTKVTIALLLSFTLIIFLVFYVVEKEGHEQIKAESERLIVQKGELVVKLISFDISSVMRSASQLKDLGEILPLERSVFEEGMDKVFVKNTLPLLGSGGIWPDAYQLESSQKVLPLLRLRESDGYSKVPLNDSISGYLDASWYKTVRVIRPQTCIWNHADISYTSKELAISCALSIERNNKFWGASSVNFTLNSVQESVDELANKIGNGYVVLIDNSNRVVAASGTKKITAMNKDTDKHTSIDDLIAANPAWQGISSAINQNRNQVINEITPKIPASLVSQLNKFDENLGTPQGSMLINYAASLQSINPHIPNAESAHMGTYNLPNEKVFRADAEAFVFTVPETLWKLVVVKPNSDVNAIADNLSKNMIKYLIFALIATAAGIFLLLDFLALRPLQETTRSIVDAEKLINENKYNKLSEVSFINVGRDEIGVVNNSLQTLLQRIENNEGKLANVNQQLEIKVQERTAKLQDTLKELKSSQIQLIRSEKMATLGQMVAGVAHEVNTPLSYVQNNLEIIGQLTELYEEVIEKVSSLKSTMTNPESSEDDIEALMSDIMATVAEIEEDDLPEELKELIKDSLFGVEQITEMVLNLRNFARLDESKIKTINIEDCIESSLKITHNSMKHLDIKTEFTDTPEIKCSPSQINQVLVNLINNAAQALGNQDDGQIKITTTNDADNVYVDVTDNGSGMTAEVQAQIFEPFFTTKGAGEGTGLGMAICHQIIEQHGGDITLKSQVGIGTSFRITLPIKGITD